MRFSFFFFCWLCEKKIKLIFYIPQHSTDVRAARGATGPQPSLIEKSGATLCSEIQTKNVSKVCQLQRSRAE